MTVTMADSAATVSPRNSTQAMKVNGPCAAVYVYTHENFFLICSAEKGEGRTVAVMSYCDTLFGPDWDWGGPDEQNGGSRVGARTDRKRRVS